MLLAAAVPARAGQTVVDLGAGAGAATLCLASRVADLSVIGVERNPDLAALLSRNAEANGMAGRITVRCADIAELSPSPDGPDPVNALPPGGADHVMANPPYRAAGTGTRHAEAWHNAANVEDGLGLADWVRIAAGCVRRKGSLVFIQHVDRLADLIAALQTCAGEISVTPLWPRVGVPARRVLVRARRGVRGGSALLPGLVLHEADGRYTGPAQAILGDAAALD